MLPTAPCYSFGCIGEGTEGLPESNRRDLPGLSECGWSYFEIGEVMTHSDDRFMEFRRLVH